MDYKISMKKVRLLDVMVKIIFIYGLLHTILRAELRDKLLIMPLYKDVLFWSWGFLTIFLSYLWCRCPHCRTKRTIALIMKNGLFEIPKESVVMCPNCDAKIEIK